MSFLKLKYKALILIKMLFKKLFDLDLIETFTKYFAKRTTAFFLG